MNWDSTKVTATAISLRRLLSDGVLMHVYKEWLLPTYVKSTSVVMYVNFIMGIAIHDDQRLLEQEEDSNGIVFQAHLEAVQLHMRGKETSIRLQHMLVEAWIPALWAIMMGKRQEDIAEDKKSGTHLRLVVPAYAQIPMTMQKSVRKRFKERACR